MTDTSIIGYIVTSGGYYALEQLSITDGTLTEVKILDISGTAVSFGIHCKGQTLYEIHPQLATGSILAQLQVTDASGGILGKWIGCERTSNQRSNCGVTKLSIPIKDGMKLKALTAD